MQNLLSARADLLSFILMQTLRTVAKRTVVFKLLENNGVSLTVNLYSVPRGNSQGVSQLDRQDDTAELIHFSNNSCRFHIPITPFSLAYLLLSSHISTPMCCHLPEQQPFDCYFRYFTGKSILCQLVNLPKIPIKNIYTYQSFHLSCGVSDDNILEDSFKKDKNTIL